MKTSIVISGQIHGNFTLRNALVRNSMEEKRTMFNGFELVFETKKEAVQAIRQAYNDLVADEPHMKNSIAGISADRARTFLRYDASTASITNPH